MVTIIDYGAGNLFSLVRSLGFIGEDAEITTDTAKVAAAEKLILPGVGAFGEAMEKLNSRGMTEAIKKAVGKGVPLLGICLGMQMLFERSYEFGVTEGLCLIPGEICPLTDDIYGLKVPHIGWNKLEFVKDDIYKSGADGGYAYYVHSFYAKNCEANTDAVSEYGVKIPGIVRKDNVCGMQFHPEKSGKTGLGMLSAFCNVKE